jgi:hypothetical chaperone protein
MGTSSQHPLSHFPAFKLLAVGIDFGTSNTAASIRAEWAGDLQHQVVELDHGALLKSLLYFPNTKESFFGRAAIEQYFEREREGRFFQSIKRLLPNPDFSGTQLGGRFVSLESLIARYLSEVKLRLESRIGVRLDEERVVFGRPARYSLDAEREALATRRFRQAIELAGFKNFELLEEPTAASRVALQKGKAASERLTLVADLGGGTSDFTLLKKGEGGTKDRVLAVHGVPLAGDALDSTFVSSRLLPFFGSEVTYQRPFSTNVLTFPKAIISRIPKWHQHVLLKEKSNWNFLLDLRKELVRSGDRVFLENLITLVEENLGYLMHQRVETLKFAACKMADLGEAEVQDALEFTFRSHPIDIRLPLKQKEYAMIIEPVVNRIRSAALETLAMAGVRTEEVELLYFTGGTAQVPEIRNAIRSELSGARVEDQDSFTSVALGLSLDSAG